MITPNQQLLLLYTKYKHAVHQPATGSAHMVCSDKTLKLLFCDASQTLRSLPAHADFTKVLVDSCSTGGPCPSIIFGDNLHIRIFCINAETSTIYLNPFGHGFPMEIRAQVQDIYDKHGTSLFLEATFKTAQTNKCVNTARQCINILNVEECSTYSVWTHQHTLSVQECLTLCV